MPISQGESEVCISASSTDPDQLTEHINVTQRHFTHMKCLFYFDGLVCGPETLICSSFKWERLFDIRSAVYIR